MRLFTRPRLLPCGRYERGQVTAFTAVLVCVLTFSLATTLDITLICGKRVQVQNAADGAATAMTTWQARGLNAVTYLNYLIAAEVVVYVVACALVPFFPGLVVLDGSWPPPYIRLTWDAQALIVAYFPAVGAINAYDVARRNHVQFGIAIPDAEPGTVDGGYLKGVPTPCPLHARKADPVTALRALLNSAGIPTSISIGFNWLPKFMRPKPLKIDLVKLVAPFIKAANLTLFFEKCDGPTEKGWGFAWDRTTRNHMLRMPTLFSVFTLLHPAMSWRLTVARAGGGWFAMRGIAQSVCYLPGKQGAEESFLLLNPMWQSDLEKFSQDEFQAATDHLTGGRASQFWSFMSKWKSLPPELKQLLGAVGVPDLPGEFEGIRH